MVRKGIRLAQNFLKDPRLAASMVAQAHLDKDDVVYEIGPGKGAITRELARACSRVIAVEKDPELFWQLKEGLADIPNVELHNGDFRHHRIQERDFKVFSSIPYNATADIMRAILWGPRRPKAAYLIMQEEAARRFAGIPRQSQWSVLAHPWWSLAIVRKLKRSDFRPVPAVESVLLRIERRPHPLVSGKDTGLYREFVLRGFGGGKASLRRNLNHTFTRAQWRRLAEDLGFDAGARPSELGKEQWLGLFRFVLWAMSRSQVVVPARWLGTRACAGQCGPPRLNARKRLDLALSDGIMALL
jgi:23S rRNA (adenine-N6)-dimethyltransferase